uniref:Uncharacterized protein n=1 Tax=Solanum tuberosum TaxID=4113 RepID=M1DMJ8_SOLTU
MTDRDEFNAVANIMIPIENPVGSRNMTDIQNEEKMARMEQELKILREELCQLRDLAKLSATTFPTFKTPIYFAKADLPSADLPNHPEQNQEHMVKFHQPLQPQFGPFLTSLIAILPYLQCSKYLGHMSPLPMSHLFHLYIPLKLLPSQRQLWLISRTKLINMQKWRKMPS